MKFLSTTEVSKKWGIGRRRIEILCANDRIPGVSMVGNTWIIPEDAEKPKDARVKNGRYKKVIKEPTPHHIKAAVSGFKTENNDETGLMQ